MISNTAAAAVVTYLQAIGEAEAAMLVAQPTPPPVAASAAAPGAPDSLVEALKLGTLMLDASPIKLI